MAKRKGCEIMKAPSVKMHFYFSLVKSIVRIVSCALGVILNDYAFALVGLAIAEFVGIVEEIF
jgi:uncharacterized membrane protein YgaE (UPF0421/DUF939 family)